VRTDIADLAARSVDKADADRYLSIHRIAHRLD
jgi:hypothetical protein